MDNANGTSICSRYGGFIPANGDGNAKIKKEFIVKKDDLQSAEKKTAIQKSEIGGEQEENVKNPKVRGQNKKRPRPQRDNLQEKLCPSKVKDEGVCTFADKCKYIHNVSNYLEIKPPDIGKECISYRTCGYCRFSFTCRFASDHVEHTPDTGYKNLIDEELKLKANAATMNTLSREMQVKLRKRKVDFSRTEDALKSVTVLQQKRRLLATAKTENSNTMEDKLTVEKTVPLIKENESDKPMKEAHSECVLETSRLGSVLDHDIIPLRFEEKKKIDFKNKLYLAPLTTCGNLPFRVVCKQLGADITCGEMALATNLLQAQTSEWALIKRHPSEDVFGVQLCGAFPDTLSRCAELLNKNCDVDFIDINLGCPIDMVYKKGAGSALMRRTNKLFDIITCMNRVLDVPLTCKLRTGIETNKNCALPLLSKMRDHGVALATVHGRSREARYTRLADWNYIDQCALAAHPMPVFGNGDVLTYQDYNSVMQNSSISGVMLARGALIKPWIFTEIKEQRDWDISSSERFDVLRKFTNQGLMHWGSDTKGVENTRRFLLEWCSFLHRYIPVGLLESAPQRINERPPYYVGRDDLETLMASPNANDWIKISELLLGKVPENFEFLPKHRANSYK